MDSGRLVAVLLLVMLMTETGVQLVCQLLPSGWELPAPPRPATPPQPGQDKQQTLNTITGHTPAVGPTPRAASEHLQARRVSERRWLGPPCGRLRSR